MEARFRKVGLWLLPVLFVGFSSGCKNCQLVEAELRYQSNRVDELEGSVLLKDAEITTLQTTVLALRDELKARGNAPPPESIYKNMGLAKITLGPLTGGRDLDNDGRPDAIEVAIQPHDFDDDVFKCPGSAEIEVFQIETNGIKKPIGHWMVDEGRLREGWRVTVMGQGFQIVEPWQGMPVTGNLRVVVHFTTLDGREFEAERDVAISMAQKLPMSRSNPNCPVDPSLLETAKRPMQLGLPVSGSNRREPPAPVAVSKVQTRWAPSGGRKGSAAMAPAGGSYVSPASAWQVKKGTKSEIVLPIPTSPDGEVEKTRAPQFHVPRFRKLSDREPTSLPTVVEPTGPDSSTASTIPVARLLQPTVVAE